MSNLRWTHFIPVNQCQVFRAPSVSVLRFGYFFHFIAILRVFVFNFHHGNRFLSKKLNEHQGFESHPV